MAVAIRLQRGGAKKRPYYRIVVTDKRMPRDGRFIEKVGTFNPMLAKDNAERLTLKKDRIEHWLKVGAKPSERVHGFLHKEGVLDEAFDVSHRPQKSRKRPDKKTRKELKTEAEEAAKAEAEAAPAEEAPVEEAEAAPAEEAAAEESTEETKE